MVESIEIGYNLELITDITAAKLIEAKLDMTKIANVFFDRSEEVDAMVLEHFVSTIMPKLELTRIRLSEKATIEKCKTRLGLGDEGRVKRDWERVSGTAKDEIETFMAREKKGRVLHIKSVAKVDEKAATALAWLMHFTSYERNKTHIKNHGDTERSGDYDYKTRSCHVAAAAAKALQQQDFIMVGSGIALSGRQTWRSGWDGNDAAFIVAFLPDEDLVNKTSFANVTAAIFVIEPLAPRFCRVTLYEMQDLEMGSLGRFEEFSIVLDDLRDKYERKDSSVDEEVRETFAELVVKNPPPMSQPELIKRCLELDDDANFSLRRSKKKNNNIFSGTRRSSGLLDIRNSLVTAFMGDGRFVQIASSSNRIKYYKKMKASMLPLVKRFLKLTETPNQYSLGHGISAARRICTPTVMTLTLFRDSLSKRSVPMNTSLRLRSVFLLNSETACLLTK